MKLNFKMALTTFVTLSLAAGPVAAGNFSASPLEKQPAGVHREDKDTTQSRHHGNHGHHPIHGGHIVKDTAELLGMEPKVLIQELKQGKSLLQVAQASKGWSEAQYTEKLTAKAFNYIDKAAAEGRISAEEAARLKARLPGKLKIMITRTWNRKSGDSPVLEYRQNQINWQKPSK